jgi:hypothetical protein
MSLNNHEMRVYAGLSPVDQESICSLHQDGALEMFTGEWVDISEQPKIDMLFTQAAYRLKMEVGKWYVHADPSTYDTKTPIKLLEIDKHEDSESQDTFEFWSPVTSLEERENYRCGRTHLNHRPATDEEVNDLMDRIAAEKHRLENPIYVDCDIDWTGHTPRIVPPWSKKKKKVALMDIPYHIPYMGFVLLDYKTCESGSIPNGPVNCDDRLGVVRRTKFVRFVKDNYKDNA